MDYSLTAGKRRQIIDESGTPIAEGTTTGSVADTAIAQFGGLDGKLYLLGLAIGTTDVTLTRGGVAQTHEVTVTNSFDWSLGAEV